MSKNYNAPRKLPVAYYVFPFRDEFNTCGSVLSSSLRGSEVRASTWNTQVSHFPGVHKPNLAMLLATSQSCKIMEKFSNEWFSGCLKTILHSGLFFQAWYFATGGWSKCKSRASQTTEATGVLHKLSKSLSSEHSVQTIIQQTLRRLICTCLLGFYLFIWGFLLSCAVLLFLFLFLYCCCWNRISLCSHESHSETKLSSLNSQHSASSVLWLKTWATTTQLCLTCL